MLSTVAINTIIALGDQIVEIFEFIREKIKIVRKKFCPKKKA
jgi:hypothetical protein